MRSRHQLVHLSTLSIDVAFIRCINWEAPTGITLYLWDREDWGSCGSVVINKEHPEYANDRTLLEIVVGRLRSSPLSQEKDERHLLHLSNFDVDVSQIKSINWGLPSGVAINLKIQSPVPEVLFLEKQDAKHLEDVRILKQAIGRPT